MTKRFFHSLGSNYTWAFAALAIRQLFSPTADMTELENVFKTQFKKTPFFFYKGRDAIEFCARLIGLSQNDVVLTQAVTCQAIEAALLRAGTQPWYVDLGKNRLSPGLEELEKARLDAVAAGKVPKLVIVQHLLGLPAESQVIAEWCHQHQMFLLEDLAQAFGGSDEQNQLLGTMADMVICSFGRDKILDAVSGGVAAVSEQFSAAAERVYHQQVTTWPPFLVVVRDMIYPLLTVSIRATSWWGGGTLLFWLGRLSGLLSSPITAPTSGMTKLPQAYVALVLRQLRDLPEQLSHRRAIAAIYATRLKEYVHQDFVMTKATWLRYPIMVHDPVAVSCALAKKQFFLSDRWYRQPVDGGRVAGSVVYHPGDCPRAEEVAQHVYNLPTHRHISASTAETLLHLLEQHHAD